MNQILPDSKDKEVVLYDYTKPTLETLFIKKISSNLLSLLKYKHNPNKWYIDVIRYKLNNDTKRIMD